MIMRLLVVVAEHQDYSDLEQLTLRIDFVTMLFDELCDP